MNISGYTTIEPKQTAECMYHFLMHGLGDSAAGIQPIIDALDLPTTHRMRFVLPDTRAACHY